MIIFKIIVFAGFFNNFGYYARYNTSENINIREVNEKINLSLSPLISPHNSILRAIEIKNKINSNKFLDYHYNNGLYVIKTYYEGSFPDKWNSFMEDFKFLFNLDNFNYNISKITLFANNKPFYLL